MNDPRLVLVDEPTASLDSERGKRVVESLAAEVKGRDKLGIMVAARRRRWPAVTDRVLAIHDGVLTEETPALA
ncbi:MAG: hypothetical protein U5Q44_14820 [Dehalococcoidia bacterium]|nr:hypothetical protein [Dehalococcoidia bacterium]